MDYSIIIPVFNKAELTRNCLAKLQPSLEGAGDGEVLVIDNASTDHTPEVLASFPWIRMIRNEKNLGFAAANNQGAREAHGRVLVLLNNDTEPITRWLAPMMRLLDDPGVGVVGAKLLYADHRIQHAGVLVRWWPFSASGLYPFHYLLGEPGNAPDANHRRDYQIVTGACLATPRELYLAFDGLDEGFWNGYEDVDYCLKVRHRGLRVVYEPAATLLHFESKSGSQRFRRTQANLQRLADHWSHRVEHDAPRVWVNAGKTEGLRRSGKGVFNLALRPVTPVDVLVHGASPEFDRKTFERSLRESSTPIGSVHWASDEHAVERARELMDLRGDRYVAFVRADTQLQAGWLDELLARVTTTVTGSAATFIDRVEGEPHVPIVASDARCVLLRLQQLPQGLVLRDFDSLDAAMADFLVRALQLERGTIGVRPHAQMGPVVRDVRFESEHGMAVADVFDRDPKAIERALRARPVFQRGLVSIVTLSWNAPEFTIKALQSIREHTAEPYEVIVVDNGSGPETLKALGGIDDPHVRIIYNKTNRGFSGGNNDGIAHARGDYVIILNNDVIVTPGWADGLVDAFRRLPGLGISAPRSNLVTGDQQLPTVQYRDESEMYAFALERRREFAHKGYITDRAIGFCWCISREVLDQIGALDERYAIGNFEDDDYCMRVRSAGYLIYVCDDVFIHHFGSRSFAANKVDYMATMNQNWERFAKKWGLSGGLPVEGYRGAETHARGFVRAKDYLPFPKAQDEAPAPERGGEPVGFDVARAIFGIAVRSEADWTEAAQFVRRFALAFKVEDGVLLAIASFGEPHSHAIASRVERILEKAGVVPEACADIDIADYDEGEWAALAQDRRWIDIDSLDDRSPSALRRLLKGLPA
ncbi:MAG TPA: glycosyltransferase family 2 protein [Alphaproteobacteria bacterium]|nr:glycosyltransferase family 2 protein [Alphaproteobacteria bacterium]